jgi:hypothetical protein
MYGRSEDSGGVLSWNVLLILFASFLIIDVKYSLRIVAMDFCSVMGFSSEIIHDGLVPDLLRDVSSLKLRLN